MDLGEKGLMISNVRKLIYTDLINERRLKITDEVYIWVDFDVNIIPIRLL